MNSKASDRESAKAILKDVQKEMAKPRMAKSARDQTPQESKVFPLSGSGWPGLARPARRPHRLVMRSGVS
jgi:hypothetical protein